MENKKSLDAADTATLENAAQLALTAFCWWRADLPREICEDYWRDVHGIMFARAPGLWQYRQLRLAPNRPDLGLSVEGISINAPAAAQPQGMPHALFLSEAHLKAFASSPLPKEYIPNDAKNFIGRIGALPSPGGRTLVDRINDPAMQGAPLAPTFVLCFVPRAGAPSVEIIHRYLAEQVARSWSGHPGVLRLRVEPLPPYEQSAMASPSVPHQWPTGETYLGWMELAVSREGIVGDLLAGATGLAEHVGIVHAYPVREIYTIISAGRPTDVGLRGYAAARTIIAAGADNQRSESLLEILFGDAIRGRDQPM
ncbi:hypothetical protein [Rhizobium sp. LC145]|uniref:hypothetical protein n=1 Tax=Rhizobium sp. LC145 TaxID=1120688 RepID=UPI00062A2A8A|nr:hypothetical protein [Rhizobium sp. LC145]KKX33774.1 ethyl tert-butyl ether degradation protein EthD [Rhizobium sp. LC145]TKT46358.1 ethyl tert-butyl ether degradation protein EthD [Rhizobiaceae bacterium LC148]